MPEKTTKKRKVAAKTPPPKTPPAKKKVKKKAPPRKSPRKASKTAEENIKKRRAKRKTSIVPPDAETDRVNSLRFLAGHYFATSLADVSVVQLSEMPQFSAVSVDRYRSWAKKDDWSGGRAAFRKELKEKLEGKLAEEIVAARIKQLKEAEQMSVDLRGKLPSAEPKSFEGMVTAYVKLEGFIDDQRQAVVGDLAQSTDATTRLGPQLSDKERDAMIGAAIKQRREEIRADEGQKLLKEGNDGEVIEGE